MSTTDSPRLAPVTEPDAEQQELLGKTLITPGSEPLNLFATLAHHPRLLKRVNALGGLFMAHGTLAPRDRELVILRTALRVGSDYEWAQHRVLGLRAGLAQEEIDRVGEQSADGWSADDRVLLTAADELSADADLTDATYAQLSARLSEQQLLELVAMVGFYRLLGGVLRGFRVQIEPGAR